MGSLRCPLCCKAEFPNRRALQLHLLDVLDLLKCPTCNKSFTSILGLVQHLSLSSCNVEVGVNFDEHFVTYVDCSFMKTNKQQQQQPSTIPPLAKIVEPPKLARQRPVPDKLICATSFPLATCTAEPELIVPDQQILQDGNVVIECLPGSGEIICINLEQGGLPGIEVLDEDKLVQKTANTTTSPMATTTSNDTAANQTEVDKDSPKKIAVPIKRYGPQSCNEKLIEDVKYIYQCEVCCQQYQTRLEFDAHECGNFICDICGTVRKTNQALNLHKKLHAREKIEQLLNEPNILSFNCDVCGITIDKNEAEDHFKTHTSGLKTFPCRLCSNTYLSMSKLNDHIKKNHADNRAYQCEICKKEFKIYGYLKAHMETHIGLKPYKCSYCNKAYNRKSDKIQHEYIHTGEKPMECPICAKRFRVSYSCKLHMRTHTNERPYECHICHKKFKSRAVRSHHIKLHGEAKPYKCPHCTKHFKTLVALTGHKNRHEKPYSCGICHRRFASKYDVKTHMPIHNNQESKDIYKCIICEAVYARHHALLEHLKEHKTSFQNKNDLEEVVKSCQVYSLTNVVEISETKSGDEVFVSQEEEVIIEEPMSPDIIAEEVLME